VLRTIAAAAVLAFTAASPANVATVPGQIVGVAQSGGAVAWLSSGASGCRLTIQSGGKSRVLPYAQDCAVLPQDLTLANGRAAWGGYQEVRCSETFAEVRTGTTSSAHLVQSIPGDCRGFGTTYQGLATDGTSFFYALLTTKNPPPGTRCGDGGPCRWTLLGGRIMRIAGAKAQPVTVLPGAALIAGAPGRLALVQPATAARSIGRTFDWPRAATNGAVVIYDTKARRAVTSFKPDGIVRAIALSRTRAVVLVQQGNDLEIQWYDAQSGVHRGTAPTPTATAHMLATDGRVVAYAVGRSIRVLDLGKLAARTVAKAASPPVGLTIDSGRLLWGENAASHGRVVAVPL
jgi:hypothetical protein